MNRRRHPNWTLADQVLRAVIPTAQRWLPDDVIILSAATGRAVVVHHSEFIFTVRGVARRWHAPKDVSVL